ncbi:MAG TPA: hypothetical protein VFR93_02240 [Candidatus Limnocylindrales bacterium]|nr:hypothetical protein [Candidatus Limnocylindrales bacterium]
MADDRHRSADDPGEARLRARFRIVAAVVILALLVLLVVASVVGPFLSPDFHGIDTVVFGTLIGALMLLLGVEGLARFPGGGPR